MFSSNRFNEILCAIFIANTIISCNCLAVESNKKNENLRGSYPWINSNLLTKAIQQDYPEKVVTINAFTLTSIPSESINYKITLIRVSVDFKIDNVNRETSFIIKTTKKEKQPTNEMNVIEQEINNYQRILPAVNKILATIDEDDHIAPRCYEANLDQYYMVLEDPGKDGFKFYSRENGLTKEHFKVTLKKLARMHAASKLFDSTINTEVQSKKCAAFGRVEIISIIEAFAKLTKNMQGFEHISKKLEHSGEHFYQKYSDAFKQEDDQIFNALCHGDVCNNHQCTNNILYKSNSNGLPTESLMADHPSICWGPVVIDLASAFYTSSNQKLRADDWDELVQYYHNELINTLKKFNYTGSQPTLNQLQVQLLERGISFVAVGLFETAERHYTGKKAEGLVFINDTNVAIQKRIEIIESAKDAAELKYMLNYFDRRGYFDF